MPNAQVNNDPYYTWESREAFRNVNFERLPDYFNEGDRNKNIESAINSRFPVVSSFFPIYKDMTEIANTRYFMIFNNVEAPLEDGQFKIEDFDKLKKYIRDSGTDMMTDKLKAQVDEWRQSKSQ